MKKAFAICVAPMKFATPGVVRPNMRSTRVLPENSLPEKYCYELAKEIKALPNWCEFTYFAYNGKISRRVAFGIRTPEEIIIEGKDDWVQMINYVFENHWTEI